MAKIIKEELIKHLAKGEFVSGQQLGDMLGVSRAAISKQIGSLSDMGLDIYSVTGKGYKLAKPLSLINPEAIADELAIQHCANKLELHTLIDSTNSYLLRKLPSQVTNGQVCIAEYQSQGRGRRGRQWVSPFGSHIYMSMYWRVEQGMAAVMGLNTVAAIAIRDAIKELYGLDVELKWPNDIYLSGKKLAGILIELEGQPAETCHCVIGIGINLDMPALSAEQVDQPWSDLQTHINTSIDRNILAAKLIASLNSRLLQHQRSGLTELKDIWHQHDLYLNKSVVVTSGENQTIGTCKGINDQGALLLEVNGQQQTLYGGELSMRPLS